MISHDWISSDLYVEIASIVEEHGEEMIAPQEAKDSALGGLSSDVPPKERMN